MWKWYDDLGTILAVILTAAIVMLIAPARADERLMGFHSQHHHGRLHHWYQKLMRPDQPNLSCCSAHDCTPTRAELRNGEWWAMRNGVWVKIPARKINREESYDSQAHICFPPNGSLYPSEHVFCFVVPGIAG